MKLSDCIETYVIKKRAAGLIFYKGECNLVAFHRYIGDLHLDQINTEQVQMYLDKVHISTATWRLKYQVLERFFEFWYFRGEIPEFFMPPPKAPVCQSFIPYIFTRSEIRALLKATVRNQKPIRRVEKQTLRTFILILYATGALVGEVLNLMQKDIDLKTGMVTITGGGASRSRQIPIGPDLQNVLRKYLAWRSKNNLTNAHLLVTKNDLPISVSIVVKNWRRLRTFAGIIRRDGSSYQPRMHDLRYTFAVHRITSWISNGADLNRMLSALAAYMGQVGLGATDRYLHLTPERFRRELNKLSPGRKKGNWRDNKVLMEFLAAL
jgi:integrase